MNLIDSNPKENVEVQTCDRFIETIETKQIGYSTKQQYINYYNNI